MRHKIGVWALVCTVVVVFIWVGTVWAQPSGKIVIAQGGEQRAIDAHKGGSTMFINTSLCIYDTLVRRNSKGNIESSLAKSYKTIDQLTWEFDLHRDVTFHNGDPLTAHDVKFSFERILDTETQFPFRTIFTTIDTVQVLDEHTVRIITKKPDPTLLSRLAAGFIVPKGYIEKHGEEYFGKNPIGSGRYRFVKWVQNDHIELEARTDYWGSEPPTVKTLVFRTVPENGARMAALQTGEVDIATNVPPFMVDPLEKDPKINVVSGPSGRVIFIGMNLLKEEQAGPLMDARVRRALNYAVDKKSIVKNILMGSGEVLATPVIPNAVGFDETIEPFPYDPAKAKELLAEAGYPEGFETEFDACSGRYLMDKQVAEAVTGMLGKIGVKVKLNILEWGQHVKVRRAHTVSPLYFLGWGSTIFDADGTLGPLFCIDCTHSNYHNPALVEMIEAARYEIDKEKRNKMYSKIFTLIKKEAPWIFLYQQYDNYGVRSRINNFHKIEGSEWMHCDMLNIVD